MKELMLFVTLLTGGLVFYFFSRISKSRNQTSAPVAPSDDETLLAKALPGDPKPSKASKSNQKILGKARNNKDQSQLTAVMLHQIGSPSESFKGRRGIILELATQNRDGVNLLGLHGCGGIGKTATMNKVLDHLIPHYRDAQIYFDLSIYKDPVQAMTQAMAFVIHTFQRNTKTPIRLPELKLAYQSALKDKKVILFFDNVTDANQAKCLLPPKTCLMAITSPTALSVPGMFQAELPEMSSDEMQDLLNQLCPRIGFWAAEISKYCGMNPLAGTLCANFLTEFQQVDPAGFSTGLRDFHKTLAQSTDDKNNVGVETVLTLIYSMFPDTLFQTLSRLTLFPDHFSADAEVFICEDKESLNLETLTRLGWVEWNDHSGRYNMPRMVREWLLSKGKSTGLSQGEERFSTYYMTLFSNIHELIQTGKEEDIIQGLAQFDLERNNLSIGQSWASKHCVRDRETSGVCNGYGEAALDVLHWRVPNKDRLDWLEPALKAAQNLQDRDMELAYMLGIAKTCRSLKKYDQAIEHINKCLSLCEKSGAIKEQLDALYVLGNSYKEQKRFDKALESFERRKSLSREHKFSDIHLETLESIGRVHLSQNAHDKAILVFKEALEQGRSENQPQLIVRLLTALGETSLSMGKPAVAESHFLEALDLNKSQNDAAQAAHLNNCLGETYFLLNEPAKASPYLETAAQLFIKSRNLGGQARAEGQGGLCKLQADDKEGGMALMQRSRKLFKQAKDLQGETEMLSRLGHIQLDKGMKPEAESTFTNLLSVAKKTKMYVQEASAEEGLGRLKEMKGDSAAAEKHYHTAHKLYQINKPLEAPRILKMLDNLAKSAKAS